MRLLLLLLAAPLAAQVPSGTSWIWTAPPTADRAWFAASFTLDRIPQAAQLGVAVDNRAGVYLNGRLVAVAEEWTTPLLLDIARDLVVGPNVLGFVARNEGGPAGLLAFVVADGQPVFRTDATTLAFKQVPPEWPSLAGGEPATVLGGYGAAPWGQLAWSSDRALRPADGLQCAEVGTGFGSLIALTLAPDGAPIVSAESGGLLRLHDDDGDGRFERASPFCEALRIVQGLCFTGEDGWATGLGPDGPGFYKLPAGDEPRAAQLVAPVDGSLGEHGPHAVLPAPDGRLWIMLGNHVQLGAPLAEEAPQPGRYEGHILQRLVDPNGHATEIAAPGGTVVAWDPVTGAWERIAAGFRNAYDMAFAPNGDLFTFDSDMEWDIGLPWYRATRVVHVRPDGDWGWRTGSAVWPAWYPDSLPPVVEAGRGSPTGVAWCDSPAFPPPWRGTLLIGDWSQGRILGVHLQPDGASWRGRTEVLLSGRPLPVTDFVFDREGALLITVGGRGARGALLRLRGTEAGLAQPARPVPFPLTPRPPALDDRTPIETLTAQLADADRTSRYLAARALERRPVEVVEGLCGPQTPPAIRGEALVVRARQAIAARDGEALARLAPTALLLMQPDVEPQTRLVAARALELLLLAGRSETLLGTGQPPDPALGAQLLPLFPAGAPALNRELALLLAHTAPDDACAALLAAVDEEPSAEEAIHLLYCASALRGGAPPAALRPALERLGALRSRPGGNSYQGYLDAIERRLVQQAPREEREALRALARPAAPAAAIAPSSGAPPRDPDRTRSYVELALDAPERSLAEGALVFARSCAACHQRGSFAGRGGPDLSTVGSRLSAGDLVTAILQPSRDVSDQYRSTVVTLRDGRELSGVVVRDDGAEIELITGLGTPQIVRTEDVAERRFSLLSAMPDGLVDGVSLTAIADLCAWLLAAEPPPAPAESAWNDERQGMTRSDSDWWTLNGGVLRNGSSVVDTGMTMSLGFDVGATLFETELRVPAGRCGIRLRDSILVAAGGEAWGSLLDQEGKLLVAPDPLMVGPSLDLDGWNHLLIDTDGRRVRVVLNGIEAATMEWNGTPAVSFALVVEPGAPLVELRTLASCSRTP